MELDGAVPKERRHRAGAGQVAGYTDTEQESRTAAGACSGEIGNEEPGIARVDRPAEPAGQRCDGGIAKVPRFIASG